MVANYYKQGPASEHTRILDMADDATGRCYVAGNVMVGDERVTADNHAGVSDLPGKPYVRHRKSAPLDSGISPDAIPLPGEATETCLVDQPFPYEPINEDTPEEAYRRIIAESGCSHARDPYDSEVIRQVSLGLGEHGDKGIINTPGDVGGWPVLKAGIPVADSDGDGMPDEWEIARGLNPRDAADASLNTLHNHYTNIEIYINSLVR